MRTLAKVLLLVALCLTPNLVLATEPNDTATCDIYVTVNPIMEWAGDFTDITLTAINAQADAPDANETQTIYTNCNFEIDADQTTAAQLSKSAPVDDLVTKYKLIYDGDGASATGGTNVDTWTEYDSFLSTPSAVTHFDGDGNVDITLHVQATCPAAEVPNSGAYSATQTLTAVWTSD